MKTDCLFGDKRKFLTLSSMLLFLVSNIYTARAETCASVAPTVAGSSVFAWSITALVAAIGLSSLWNRLSRPRRPSKG